MASINFNISPLSGSDNGTVTVLPNSNNYDGETRSVTVRVSNGRLTKPVTFTQRPAPQLYWVGDSYVPKTGGTLTLYVSSAYNFYWDSVPVVVSSIESGGVNYRGYTDENNTISAGDWTFTVTVGQSPFINDSTYSIKIVFRLIAGGLSTDYDGGDGFSLTFTHRGDAKYISCGDIIDADTGIPTSTIPATSSGNTYTVDISSNTSWIATTSYSYLTITDGASGSSGTTTLQFTVNNNVSSFSRVGKIKLTSSDSSVQTDLSITQAGA